MPREAMHCGSCGHDNRAAAHFCGLCGAPLRATPPLVGGRYRLERQLGAGTFGRAILAFDVVLRRRCVVKQLRLDTTPAELHGQVTAAFEREARLLVRLNTPGHPNIPEIYEYVPAQRSLVMKYITGKSLQQVLKSRLTPLPEETALRYARRLLGPRLHARAHARSCDPRRSKARQYPARHRRAHLAG